MGIDYILQRDDLTTPSEMSALASGLESKGLFRNWTHTRQNSRRAGKLTNVSSQLQQQFRLQQTMTRMHPFQIYQYPEYLRTFQNTNDWQRFKVRDGTIFLQNDNASYSAAGSDNAVATAYGFANSSDYPWFTFDLVGSPPRTNQQPPTDSSTVITSQWNEAVVPANGTLYYFWASACAADGSGLPLSVLFGSSATGATDLFNGTTVNDPWPKFPINDPYHWLIGSIMWISSKQSYVINQVQKGHIHANLPPVAVATTYNYVQERFAGVYSSSNNYWVGDVVLQTVASGAGPNWLYRWIHSPPNGTSFPISGGPITNIDPQTHNPDPWVLTSKSPIDADYHIDASYQAAKAYLRSA